jgi:histidinol phosphatase-like PHP family hydrolase
MHLWIIDKDTAVYDPDKCRAIPNMHIHTSFCYHATNSIDDVADFQKSHKLFGAINEHIELPPGFGKKDLVIDSVNEDKSPSNANRQRFIDRHGIHVDDIPNLIKRRIELLGKGIGYDILPVGFEIDFIPGYEDWTLSALKRIENDFSSYGIPLNQLSCSVHYVDGQSLFAGEGIREYVSENSAVQLISRYFDSQCKAVSAGLFDFICHPGLVHMGIAVQAGVKGIMRDQGVSSAYFSGFRDLVDLCAEKGVLMEINTSGIHRYSPEDLLTEYDSEGLFEGPNPNFPFSMMIYAASKGIGFVVGSDWHYPDEKGSTANAALRYFDQVYDALSMIGVKEVFKIVDRQKVPVPLS